jgi:cyanophycinase
MIEQPGPDTETPHSSGIRKTIQAIVAGVTICLATESVLPEELSEQKPPHDPGSPNGQNLKGGSGAFNGPLSESSGIKPATAEAVFQPPPAINRKLVLVGGGEVPAEARAQFIGAAGGEQARILIIPWATSDPEGSVQAFREASAIYDPESLDAAPTRDEMLECADFKATFLKQLENASGVWFTGGDQNRAMEIVDPEIRGALHAKFNSGTVFGGTSAGCALMSAVMITGEWEHSDPQHPHMQSAPGLGLLKGAVLDQHFIKRNREGRLLDVLKTRGESVGVGVDEDTALIVENNREAKVIGGGGVVIFYRISGESEFSSRQFGAGGTLDLSTWIEECDRK